MKPFRPKNALIVMALSISLLCPASLAIANQQPNATDNTSTTIENSMVESRIGATLYPGPPLDITKDKRKLRVNNWVRPEKKFVEGGMSVQCISANLPAGVVKMCPRLAYSNKRIAKSGSWRLNKESPIHKYTNVAVSLSGMGNSVKLCSYGQVMFKTGKEWTYAYTPSASPLKSIL